MKKETLRTKIFNSAREIVQQEGIANLNVRKVAKLSDCSLGSIYNAFESFEVLQLHINASVLSDLFSILQHVVEKGMKDKKSIQDIFRDLGHAYVAFGNNNKFLWKAVFEHFPADSLPDWYGKLAREGVNRICSDLATYSKMPLVDLERKVGFFWAAVHGIGAILLNRKMEMVTDLFKKDELDSYIDCSVAGIFGNKS